MFVSTDFLAIHYGVDDKIAKFFVDRDPPAGNLYWKDKLMYLRFQPGYLFIPLIVDLLYKAGIERQQLLSEPFVQLMEAVGHVSALEESGKITQQQAIEQCIELATPVCTNTLFLTELKAYLLEQPGSIFATYTTGFNALHRGDLFLFAVSALNTGAVDHHKIVQLWFALISSLLLQDDAEDINEDVKNNDANAFVESGMNEAGYEKIKQIVKRNLQLIASLNKTMAYKLDQQLLAMFDKPIFRQLYKLN